MIHIDKYKEVVEVEGDLKEILSDIIYAVMETSVEVSKTNGMPLSESFDSIWDMLKILMAEYKGKFLAAFGAEDKNGT